MAGPRWRTTAVLPAARHFPPPTEARRRRRCGCPKWVLQRCCTRATPSTRRAARRIQVPPKVGPAAGGAQQVPVPPWPSFRPTTELPSSLDSQNQTSEGERWERWCAGRRAFPWASPPVPGGVRRRCSRPDLALASLLSGGRIRGVGW
ncbi:hypothetical protein PVAP13_7NG297524 [Panicum virgatum]|uniref:Uncharacterized protein n=1 Tax=Panicum virgatum TaxID=38727 RepID=A0A8T0QBG1_PANVG|nr:hypothetical protein PVAP13_7NG297524 [Panicum virgatum]